MTETGLVGGKEAMLAGLLGDLGRLLRFQRSLGAEEYFLPVELHTLLSAPPRPVSSQAKVAPQKEPAASRNSSVDPPVNTIKPLPTQADDSALAELHQEVSSCRLCPRHLLCQRPISGVGRAGVALLIVADLPTADDDASGVPFAGETGALLDRMLAAIGQSRSSVYLSQLLKCHAPQDADSMLEQNADICLPFLKREIVAVAPKLICAMGPLVNRKLLRSGKPLSQLRGRFHDFHGIPLMPTFHPDFLLRNPEMKKVAWLDLQQIQERRRHLCEK